MSAFAITQAACEAGGGTFSLGDCYCDSPRIWSINTCECPQVNQYWNGSSCVITSSSEAIRMNNCSAIICEAYSYCIGGTCSGSTDKEQAFWNGSTCICPTGYYSNEASTVGGATKPSSGGGSSSSGSSGVSSGGSWSYTSTYVPGNTGSVDISMPTVTSTGTLTNPIKAASFSALIQGIIDWVINIALVLAPLVIVFGGFIYMTAAGDTNKVSQGKQIILYAVIGFIVALLAKSLVLMFTKLIAS